jgi:hypothetical protein
MIDWSRYAVGGAAARPDSFTGLNKDYAAAIAQMLLAAEAELGPDALKITSAYRSPELQAQLFDAAVAKYGSPEAARKWVAPPGQSMHNKGLAVDFAGPSGGLLRDPKSPEAQWIAQNAARFGLAVPMSWEPWQVELAGARGGASVSMPDMPMSMGQPAPMMGQMPQEDPFEGMGLLSRFAASRGIAQDADASPIANLLNIFTQKEDPRLKALAQQRGGFMGLLGF